MESILLAFRDDVDFNSSYAWAAELSKRLNTRLKLLCAFDGTDKSASLLLNMIARAESFYLKNSGSNELLQPQHAERIFVKGSFDDCVRKISHYAYDDIVVLESDVVSPATRKELVDRGIKLIILGNARATVVPGKAVEEWFIDILGNAALINIPHAFFNKLGNDKRLFNYISSVFTKQDLHVAYERLSYHVEDTPLAVIEWDHQLNIKRWSTRAEEIFGWTSEEIVGTNRYDPSFRIVYKDDAEAVVRVEGELMTGVVDRNLSHNRNYTKAGKVIHCEWYNSILRDEDGNVLKIVSLVLDVTERKRKDQTLRKSYNQIRQLTEHLQNIREEERTHIAREIHDELGGQLTALRMDASWLSTKFANEEKDVRQRLKNLLDIMDSMRDSMGRIASELRPSMLDNLGLVAAMEWQLEEFQVRFEVKTRFSKPVMEPTIPEAYKNGLFRILQESLTNVARHARAKNVMIELRQKEDQLVLRIEDDGQGFDLNKESREKTFGILGMKERTSMMGGDCLIISVPGEGTSITVVIPVKSPGK